MVERRQPSTTSTEGGGGGGGGSGGGDVERDDEHTPHVLVPSSETYESIADEQETYIIHFPKDQIFSTPPAENSIIAERYRNPEKKDWRRSKRLWYIIATLVVLVALIGIIIGATHLLFNPKAPSFSIHNVNIQHSSSSSSTEHYVIKLKSKNENRKFGNIYGNNGDAILSFNGHKIGKGKFPEFDQDADFSTSFELRLTGESNGGLSQDIEKKRHVALRLEMNNVPVKMNVWSKVINVVCDFKVSSLGSVHENIISQQCQSNFQ